MKNCLRIWISLLLLVSVLISTAPAAFAGSSNSNQFKGFNGSFYSNSLEIKPYPGSIKQCKTVPFYYAEASSELKEGNILFSAAYAIDETVNRPWVEGVRGSGSGESLTLYFSRETPINVLSLRLGYARSRDHYYNNNRPKTIRFEFSDGSQADYVFGDSNQEQLVQLSKTVKTSYVKMTIQDVYSGKCDDTCIYLVKAYESATASPDNLPYEAGAAVNKKGLFSVSADVFTEMLLGTVNSRTFLEEFGLEPLFSYVKSKAGYYVVYYDGMALLKLSMWKDGEKVSGSAKFGAVLMDGPCYVQEQIPCMVSCYAAAALLTSPDTTFDDAGRLCLSLFVNAAAEGEDAGYCHTEIQNGKLTCSLDASVLDEKEESWFYLFMIAEPSQTTDLP